MTGTIGSAAITRSAWGTCAPRTSVTDLPAAAPGALSAFFLYLHDFETDSSDEIDIELPAGEPHRAILTVWRRSAGPSPGGVMRVSRYEFGPPEGTLRFVDGHRRGG
jgi:hypothetical protein